MPARKEAMTLTSEPTKDQRREGGPAALRADTAKLVRAALGETFKGTRFSVRSSTYSGGASIDVRWTDGPTGEQVDAVAQLYAGATFDGMIDLKSYHSSILVGPDGPKEVRF